MRDVRRLNSGDLLSAVAALVLLVLMFATAWYGVDQLPSAGLAGAGRATAENAWHGLTLVRWVMLLTICVAIGAAVLHGSQRTHGTQTDTGAAVMALGILTSLLLVYRVLIALPDPSRVVDQKLGAVVGLLSALGIALGGYSSLRQERSQAVGASRRAAAPLASDRPAR